MCRGLGRASKQAATDLWQAKEALSKVLGIGISFDMLAIDSGMTAGPWDNSATAFSTAGETP